MNSGSWGRDPRERPEGKVSNGASRYVEVFSYQKSKGKKQNYIEKIKKDSATESTDYQVIRVQDIKNQGISIIVD